MRKKVIINRIMTAVIAVVLACALVVGDPVSADADSGGAVRLRSTVSKIWAMNGSDKLNIKTLSKQKDGAFDIMQGSCTDGKKYVYFALNRKSDDAVRILKMQLTENLSKPKATKLKYVKTSSILTGPTHGNDLAYVRNAGGSGKDKILIVSENTGGRAGTYIGTFDVATMKEDGGKAYRYWNDLTQCDPVAYPEDTTVSASKQRSVEDLVMDKHGYSTIAYNAKRDVLVTTNKTDRDIMILDPVWKSDGTLKSVQLLRYIRQNKNNALSQGIDCDDDFIYTCWSPQSGKLSSNILQIYNWDGERVGTMTLSGSYEIEDVFHIGTGTDARFYATFYTSYDKTVKVKVKYKVKWKKVKKKVDGKWKKVWKYKTKTKKVKKTLHLRDSYLMYLGNLTTKK